MTKRILFSLLAAGAMFGCKPKTLTEQYKPIVQGVWVKKEYLDKVLELKSPAAVPQTLQDIIILNIDTKQIKGDSLAVTVGKASHDMAVVYLFFRPGKIPGTVKIADSEMDYAIEGKDTILNVHFEKNGKKMVMPYVKVIQGEPRDKLGKGLDEALNKNLFAGNYNFTDSTGAVKEVTFTVDGKISGLANYKTYYVNNDFIVGVNNIDGLTFDMATPKKTSGLAFKISGDTVKLFNTTFDEAAAKTTITTLKYQLIRKK